MPALYKTYLVGGVSFRFIVFLFEEYQLSKHKNNRQPGPCPRLAVVFDKRLNADGPYAGEVIRHLHAPVANVDVVLEVQEIPLRYTEVFAEA